MVFFSFLYFIDIFYFIITFVCKCLLISVFIFSNHKYKQLLTKVTKGKTLVVIVLFVVFLLHALFLNFFLNIRIFLQNHILDYLHRGRSVGKWLRRVSPVVLTCGDGWQLRRRGFWDAPQGQSARWVSLDQQLMEGLPPAEEEPSHRRTDQELGGRGADVSKSENLKLQISPITPGKVVFIKFSS